MGEGGEEGRIRKGGSKGKSQKGGEGIIGENIEVINNGKIKGGIGGNGGLKEGVKNDEVKFKQGINRIKIKNK